MSLNLARLPKSRILELDRGRCKHGHSYLAHRNCAMMELDWLQEKIGFLDIEASHLKANWGIMLTWCIKPENNDEILFGVIREEDIKKGIEDRRITEGLIRAMRRFDRVCGYYSTGFDIPFIRTRALINGVEFPEYGEIFHTDLYYQARRLLQLHSNRQAVVAETLLGATEKTPIKPTYWMDALRGKRSAILEVLDHNKRDVRDLEKIYHTLKPFGKMRGVSI